MNKEKFNSILTELARNKILANYPLVYLLDIPTSKEITGLDPNIGTNDIYIFIRNISSKPLLKGSSFQLLVPVSNPTNYLCTSIYIKDFSMNRSFEIEELYDGYSAIGLLEFKDGIPPIIYKMREYMSEWDSEYENFYLMDKELLTLVLNYDISSLELDLDI